MWIELNNFLINTNILRGIEFLGESIRLLIGDYVKPLNFKSEEEAKNAFNILSAILKAKKL